MFLTPMLSWWQWLALAAVPPAIVLLYFLKLKRQPLEVPSTYLWTRSIEDLHVNSIWQRLRQSLLLFLQLLLIALAIFALLRPSWRGTKLSGDRFVFLIDSSASMSASDVKPTRLEEAKRRVGELIDQMSTGDVAMLVSFSDNAKVEQTFTDNRRELRRRLDAIRPTNRTTALGEALRVAAGLANPGRAAFEISDTQVAESLPATVYIFSDGKFPDVEGFSLGNLKPVFVPIGNPAARNVGITAFSVRRPEGKTDKLQAFGRLENAGVDDVSVEVSLSLDGELIDAEKLDIKSREAGSVVFDLDEVHGGGVLKLRASAGDDLALDDEASLAVNRPRRARVLLVSPGNEALELALGTDSAAELADITIVRPDVLKTKEHQQQAAAGAYDLIVYDACQPSEMPQANTLLVGRTPPGQRWSAKPKAAAPQVIDVNGSHPLTQLIDMGNVSFAEGTPLMAPPGSTVLIDSDAGVLFAVGTREGYEDAVLGVEIVGVNDKGEKYANTDWPLRLSFPVFVLNALEYLGGSRESVAIGSVLPGAQVTLRSAAPTDHLQVETPSHATIEVRRGKLNTFNFSQTDELGVYAVREGKKVSQQFAVNLFDSSESDIPPRPDGTIKIGFVDVEGESGREAARREAWKPLLVGALAVLLLEWYIYNRRVYL